MVLSIQETPTRGYTKDFLVEKLHCSAAEELKPSLMIHQPLTSTKVPVYRNRDMACTQLADVGTNPSEQNNSLARTRLLWCFPAPSWWFIEVQEELTSSQAEPGQQSTLSSGPEPSPKLSPPPPESPVTAEEPDSAVLSPPPLIPLTSRQFSFHYYYYHYFSFNYYYCCPYYSIWLFICKYCLLFHQLSTTFRSLLRMACPLLKYYHIL